MGTNQTVFIRLHRDLVGDAIQSIRIAIPSILVGVSDRLCKYWLSVENSTLAPDGYRRLVMCFNGTMPGPAIVADWGDNLVIHVTNNMQDNGTAIH
ncbi:unnamed protein product [Clonostachys rosea]|uniref:Plastocyanin-like domain-containing protein n=1 Tax=Bionectria ochroleuca TaxID=29856 RepID=A0ABY6UXF3_BIOOC|nr:unnamed protein product [Clonostachys rosea]